MGKGARGRHGILEPRLVLSCPTPRDAAALGVSANHGRVVPRSAMRALASPAGLQACTARRRLPATEAEGERGRRLGCLTEFVAPAALDRWMPSMLGTKAKSNTTSRSNRPSHVDCDGRQQDRTGQAVKTYWHTACMLWQWHVGTGEKCSMQRRAGLCTLQLA